MRALQVLALLAVTAFALPTAAQEAERSIRDHPGYFPLDELEILDPEHLELEINLHAPMLRVVAAATRGSDPDFAELVANLESVRVRIAPLDRVDADEVRADVLRASRWLRERGWQTIVRTGGGDEQIHVYLREVGGEIVGIAVLAIAGNEEATVLNITGPIDLAQLVKLGEKFDISLLGELELEDRKGPAEDKPRKTQDE